MSAELPKVSVIVPVYNAEKYLRQCLDSVLGQTLEEIEVIVVDDGSTDSSPQIIAEYVAKDSRMVSFRQENQGVNAARNFGIAHIHGQYFTFIDADDWIDLGTYEAMYNLAIQQNLDLVQFAEPSGQELHELDGRMLEKAEFINRVVRAKMLHGYGSSLLWNHLYRYIPEITSFESSTSLNGGDYIFNLQYFRYVQRYLFLDRQFCHYRTTLISLSRTYRKKSFESLLNMMNFRRRLLPMFGFSEDECRIEHAIWYMQNLRNLGIKLSRSSLSFFEKLRELRCFLENPLTKEMLGVLKTRGKMTRTARLLQHPPLFLVACGLRNSIRWIWIKVRDHRE
ncbi:MAG: glycosyltransferase [Thermoguttaceae bacterium]|nr:glycosyltransferase [Thermoguttaceae bacterium]